MRQLLENLPKEYVKYERRFIVKVISIKHDSIAYLIYLKTVFLKLKENLVIIFLQIIKASMSL